MLLFPPYIFKTSLNANQINIIHNLASNLEENNVNIKSYDKDHMVRLSNAKWILDTPPNQILYNLLSGCINKSNQDLFNFNITQSYDCIQYTIYDSTYKGKYDWHIDQNMGTFSRKLSLVIQLTNPDEYEGGELQIKNYDTENTIFNVPKQLGLITIFPSYMWHRVTPVTKGIRKSLVWWVGGSPY